MDRKLYEDIKLAISKYLSQFDFDNDEPQKVYEAMNEVRNSLSRNLEANREYYNRIAVVLAYFETTRHKKFEFLDAYFKDIFESYFGKEIYFNLHYNSMIENNEIVNAILDTKNINLIQKVYENVRNLNEKNPENKKINNFFAQFELMCAKKGIFENSEEVIREYEEKVKEEKRDKIFSEASSNIGVSTDNLINKVDKVADSYDVNYIEVSPEVITKMAANSAIVSTMPKNSFEMFVNKVKEGRMLSKLNLDIVEAEGMPKLVITSKETAYDKIATAGHEVVEAISHKSKKHINRFKSVVKTDDGVISKIKASIVNLNNKLKKSEPEEQKNNGQNFDELLERIVAEDKKRKEEESKNSFYQSYNEYKNQKTENKEQVVDEQESIVDFYDRMKKEDPTIFDNFSMETPKADAFIEKIQKLNQEFDQIKNSYNDEVTPKTH